MKKIPSCLIAIFLVLIQQIQAQQTPDLDWEISLGGSDFEKGENIIQTSDGGFISCGYTQSNDNDVSGNHGAGDAWVVKLSATGTIVWQKCLGGSEADELVSVRELPNTNLILVGSTSSTNGDVSRGHGQKDLWLVKLNTNGNLLSERCLGGALMDEACEINLTNDGGFIIAGTTYSTDGDVSQNKGGSDCWVIKLNANLKIEWEKSFGGSGDDEGSDVHQTMDDGYIVSASTFSVDGEGLGNHGETDGLILRLDSYGNLIWSRCFGGLFGDHIHSILEEANGEFVFCGRTRSNDGDVHGQHSVDDGKDYLFARLDAQGNTLYQKCFGGSKDDCSYDLIRTQEEGLALVGHSYSNDGDVSGNHNEGKPDYWLIVLDSNDSISWQKCLGGIGGKFLTGDNPYSVFQSFDGGFVMTGRSDSPDGDVTGNHGEEDMWVVKLKTALPDCIPPTGLLNSNITSSSAKLSWNNISVATSYGIRYRKSGTSQWINTTSILNRKTIGALEANATYLWQVKSVCQDEPSVASVWSAKSSFSTLPAKITTSLREKISVFPNPVSDVATLGIESSYDQPCRIEVMNAEGITTLIVYNGMLNSGFHQFPIDVIKLKPAIYFLKVNSEEFTEIMKLMVQ